MGGYEAALTLIFSIKGGLYLTFRAFKIYYLSIFAQVKPFSFILF
jgi:hypothetical protein